MSDLLLHGIDWAFTDSETNSHVHDFHPYPARFVPQIPATLIGQLSQAGETVLDPYCGGGTTVVEASLSGRNAIGNDLNPVGVLITKVKTTPLSEQRLSVLDPWLQALNADQQLIMGQEMMFVPYTPVAEPNIPNIPNMEHWFSLEAKKDLGLLSTRIAQLDDVDVRDFCRVALSAIIVRVSNQDSETRYARRIKNIKPGETISLFQRKLRDMRSRMLEYVRLREASGSVTVHTYCEDTREMRSVGDGTVQLAVTSPPYPNAFDYHLYHRFRLFWLGFDPLAMARKEIGSHLNYQRNGENMDAYVRDMTSCFARINRALEMGRHFCLVIGDSVFKGQVVKNDEILADIGRACGFAVEHNFKRMLPRTQRSFPTAARRLSDESILVLRKVADSRD